MKLIYTLTLDGVLPTAGPVTADMDLAGRVIQKKLLLNMVENFLPFEKVEGLALTQSRNLWAVLDNDGGQYEPLLVDLGRLSRALKVWPIVTDSDDGDDDGDDDHHGHGHQKRKKEKKHRK